MPNASERPPQRRLPCARRRRASAGYFFFSVCSVCLRRRGLYFFSLSFSPPDLASQRVVVVARLVANEKHGFDLFLAFGHLRQAPRFKPLDCAGAHGSGTGVWCPRGRFYPGGAPSGQGPILTVARVTRGLPIAPATLDKLPVSATLRVREVAPRQFSPPRVLRIRAGRRVHIRRRFAYTRRYRNTKPAPDPCTGHGKLESRGAVVLRLRFACLCRAIRGRVRTGGVQNRP